MAALTLALAACAGGSSITGTSSDTSSASSTGVSPSTNAATDQTTSDSSTAESAPITTPEPQSVLERIADLDSAPSGEAPDSVLGTPDFAAAESIGADLLAGADASGIETWVFPVIGSDDVLLVLDIEESDIEESQVAEESAGVDLAEFLANSPGVAAAGVTHLVINLNTTDAEGSLTITFVIPVEAVLEAEASGTDLPEGAVSFQISRDGVTQ